MTSYGVDVSEWQRDIDWASVTIDFAVIRAGYGLGHPDPFFAANWAGAGVAGIARGAYLWFRASQDPIAQAAYLAAAGVGAELAPWVDFERESWDGPNTVDGLQPAMALARLAAMVDELERRDGRTPTLYTGPSFWRSFGRPDARWGRYPLAIAHYGVSVPDVPPPWGGYTFWQHSSAGNVPGVGGLVDLDVSLTPLLTAAPAKAQEHPYMHLNAPVVEIVPTPDDGGYWQVAADGGVFAFGNATPITSDIVNQRLAAPIVGAARTSDAQGLWLNGADGGVFALGTAKDHYHGSIPGLPG